MARLARWVLALAAAVMPVYRTPYHAQLIKRRSSRAGGDTRPWPDSCQQHPIHDAIIDIGTERPRI